MRLISIKMAGFKSFVDPTVFQAPTNLTGVVGPNGCGKSNIIDAVRWVMGEGSAKVLRGESMVDVIFSGSSTRKPVGTATVELVFDNSDGRVAGQFAGFNEISLKRQVSRDGVSVYYLNGTRCRRKDVRDLLLGTGLGSRSYSIIEQGMISEVVEAKPDEIRAHLEEAAGISKYKERRRETERRIQHTRDNLSRLSDLREEVGKHLARLKRQAKAAERYRELKQQRRQLESRLLTLQWRELAEQAKAGQRDLAARETAMQESVAAQRSAEAALETLHQQQVEASENFSAVQGELYGVGSEIAGLEQAIKHARELRQRQQDEFEETKTALQDLEKHMVLDKAQVEELTGALAEVEPALAAAIDTEKAASEALAEAEQAVQAWQEQFERHHRASMERNTEADRCRSSVEVLDQRLMQSARRLEALGLEAESIDVSGLRDAADELGKESGELGDAEQSLESELASHRERLKEFQQEKQAAEDALRDARRQLHLREGRLESLTAMQESALRDTSGQDWLENHGLDGASRLAQDLEVEEGWETAVETVLGHWLQSVLVENGSVDGDALAKLDGSTLAFLHSGRGKTEAVEGSLAGLVKAPDAVIAWLNPVMPRDTLEQAWAERSGLAEGQSFITPLGEWVGKDWVRISRGQDDQDSMLAREKEMSRLREEIAGLEAEAERAAGQAGQSEQKIAETEQTVADMQQRLNALHRKRNEVDGQLESRQSSIRLMEGRQQGITDEQAQLKEQIAKDEAAVRESRGRLDVLIGEMGELKEERDRLEKRRTELMSERDAARKAAAAATQTRYDLALKAESRRASLESLRQSLARMDTQLSQMQQRYLNLSEQLARTERPDEKHQAQMDGLLQQRVEIEKRLALSRQQVQELENDYREKDADRQRAIQRSDEIRNELERARLRQQEVELDARNVRRQVENLDADVDELVESLPEGADPASWEQELENLQERIVRLEPVNLAAIQEFEEEKKRKDYLDQQNEDLCDALATLENAIAKIDRKTRTRFKETFERVNKGVQELFPRLFGGGHAYLELTGEDLLTTGVSIMAQPPGKRVSSLHLLSGGEKALTAVSFVFSIFRLNPAPFCMLDEVDAPLDDANVARFCSMVKEMSETVQFIYVTHNKITMEMAHQMSGVTMREPGVSRLVQVDIDEAARLAGS